MRMLVIGTNVTNDILKIAIYPTLSPNLEELFYKQEALPSVITACDNLYQKKWPLKSSIRKQVTHYFEQFYSIEAFTHHIEMEILRKKIDYSKLRIPLEQQFPQFVWTQIGINHMSDEKSNLFLEFVPIAYTEEEFPFTIQLDASLQQQASAGVSDANDFKEQLAKIVQSVIDEQNVTFESRVKLYERPWFRKPYARIMKMDYDNLLRKAAYFDLLQSESYLLEKKALIEGNTDVRSSL